MANHRNKYKKPIDAIRDKCKKDCCNGSLEEVLKCPIKDCPLWFFRVDPADIDIEEPEIDTTEDELNEMNKAKNRTIPKGRSLFKKPIKME